MAGRPEAPALAGGATRKSDAQCLPGSPEKSEFVQTKTFQRADK